MKLVRFALLLGFALLSGKPGYSQSPTFEWVAQSGAATTFSGGYGIAHDALGNVYVTGRFTGTIDFDPGAGVANLTSAGSMDTYITKVDAAGNLVWARRVGGPNDDYSFDVSVDEGGNVYVTGAFSGTADFDPGAGTFNLSSIGAFFDDIFVIKLDANGNLAWAKRMGSSDFDFGRSIVVSASGNVITTGSFRGTVDFDPGPGTSFLTSTSGGNDIFVSKLNSAGNFVWAKRLGGTGNDIGYGVTVDVAENVFTTGSFSSTADFDPGPSNFDMTVAGNNDIFISKLDASGNFVWAKRMGGTDSETGFGIQVDYAGNVYTTGDFHGTADFDPSTGTANLVSAGFNDSFIAKLDPSGNYLWAKGMGGPIDDAGRSIALDGYGNVYATGEFESTADFDPGPGTFNLTTGGPTDGFVVKLDASGNFVWAQAFGGLGTPLPGGIDVDIFGSIYTTGPFSGTVDFDTGPAVFNATSAGSNDTFIHKMRQASTPPTISSFAPTHGPVGTAVIIDGTNFSPTPGHNTVYFGATRAIVTAATTTQLTVTVPFGTTFERISVAVNGLTAFSAAPFLVTFPDGGLIDACTFGPSVAFSAGNQPYGIAMADIDGDGKSDVAVSNKADASVSVFRNQSTPGSIGATSFAAKMDFVTGTTPDGITFADVDGDGKLDMIVASYGSNFISIFRNTSVSGTISFVPRVDFITGTSPSFIAAGDLNADGKTDLVVTSAGSNAISIYENTATVGTVTTSSLAAPVHIATLGTPSAVEIVDLDSDGKPDITETHYLSTTLGVFRNIHSGGAIAAGSFATRQDFTIGTFAEFMDVGDLDGDNLPDIVTSNWASATVSVLKNTSTSGLISFAAKVDLGPGSEPRGVIITDVDGDGKPDISVALQIAGAIGVFKNVATTGVIDATSFSAPVNYPGFGNARQLVMGDLDGDGKPDAASPNFSGAAFGAMRNTGSSNTRPNITVLSPSTGGVGTSVLLNGTGFGSNPANNIIYFGATRATVTSATTSQLEVTVPNGSTYSPVTALVGCQIGYSRHPYIATFAGGGAIIPTTFATKVDFSTGAGSRPADIELGDFNGDGLADVVTINDQNSTVSVFRNTSTSGTISFAARADLAAGPSSQNMEVGDIDGDGKLDLITMSDGGSQVSVFRNTSTLASISFAPRISFATGAGPVGVAVTDIDKDGKTDLVVVRSSAFMSVFLSTGSAGMISFGARQDFATGTNAYSIAVGDINGDGKADVMTANRGSNTVSVFENISTVGTAAFNTRVDLSTGAGSQPHGVAVGDVDLDGKPDIIAANYTNRTVSIFRTNITGGTIAAGSFDARVDLSNGATGAPTYLSIGDLNGDGKPEILMGNDTGTLMQVHKNNSTPGSITVGSFSAKVDYTTGTRPYNVISGDVDNDGLPDIVSTNASSNSISILRNVSTSSCVPPVERAALVALYNATDGANWTDNSGWLTDPDEDNWNGVLVAGCRVVEVDLSNNNLVGSLPPEIGDLTALTNLELSNNQLTGEIPAEISTMTSLTRLSLTFNQIYGAIPPEIGNLTNLTRLWLGSNQLYGAIPDEIWNLTSLVQLHLFSNQLDGTLPPDIGNLINLTSLRLGGNYFHSGIPAEIGNLTSLTTLQLDHNYFDGSIPIEIGNLTNLTQLHLNNNQLSGAIPIEIGNAPNNLNLALDHNFFTDLPDLSTTSLNTLSANITVNDNHLTFEDLEPNTDFNSITLGPQALVPPGGFEGFVPPGPLFISFATPGTNNSYQWLKGGLPIAGQTASNLNIAATTGADVGFYSVRITSSLVPGVTLESLPYVVYTDVCSPVTRTAGELDATFDPLTGLSSIFSTPGIQSDGKIIVYASNATVNSISLDGLARFNSDGSLDNTFPINTYYGTYLIQPDDKTIVSFGNGGMIRLNSDGTDDPSFTNPSFYNAFITALALQPDGKVVVAVVEDGSAYLTRLNSNGTADGTFSPLGITDVNVIRVQTDGKILIGGQFSGGIARLDPSGAYDPGFSAVAGDFVTDIALQADGKIIVTGLFSYFNNLPHRNLVRLNTDGTIDNTFSAVGITDLLEDGNYPSQIAIQSDGKIILGGLFETVNGTSRSNLIRLHTDGTVDCYLDPEESTETSGDVSERRITGLALQPDGKIVITGAFEEYGNVQRFGLARVNNLLGIFPPSITNFSPQSGPVGATVTITGSNFSTVSANNIVYFGAVKASVTTATSTQLTITVPPGTSYHPISISVNGLTAYSNSPFVITFPGGPIDACSLTARVDLETIGTSFYLNGAAHTDLDGDGKVDLVVANRAGNFFSVYRNIGTSGTLTPASFATRIDFVAATFPRYIVTGDIDGDGKKDLAVVNETGNSISIFKNNSTPGSIALGPKVDFATGANPWWADIKDIDGDGKPEVIVSSNGNGISVYPNTSTSGVINSGSLGASINFAAGTTPIAFFVADLEGDNKPDIAVPNQTSTTLYFYRNTSTPGSISFVTTTLIAPSNILALSSGDIDGDGKLDMVATNSAATLAYVYRSTSTLGTISFAAPVTFTYSYVFPDLDGDGKVDLGGFGSSVYFLRNLSTPGTISFGPKTDFSTTIHPTHFGISFGDIDADGKPDILTANNEISIYRNTIGEISPPTIASFSPSSGPIGSSVTLLGTNFSGSFSTSVRFNGTTAPIIDLQPTSIIVSVPAGATTGLIQVTVGCNSVSSATNFTVCIPPAAPGTVSANRCGAGTVDLGATGTTNGNYRWYTLSSGGTAISGAVNDTYITPSLSATTNYFVAINDGFCESARTIVTATINPLPSAPITIPGTGCAPSSVVMVNASGGTSGQYRWYTASTGGTPIAGQTTSSLVTPVLTNTTTYFVSIDNGTCESSRTPVLAQIISCTPQITATSLTTQVGGQTSLDIAPLVTTFNSPIDVNSIKVITQPLSGAVASVNNGVLNVNYSNISFAGTDKLTIEACDMASHCAQQDITIQVAGEIVVYNALSPNGDSKNEIFYIQFIDLLPNTKNNKVTIFNRNGSIVFEVENYDNVNRVFRGINSSGNELPTGTYFYRIDFNGGAEPKTGFISLRR